MEGEIQSVNTILQQRQQNLGELEEVRRRYRQNGYDSYNSSFPGNFSLEVLLGQMLGGMMNSDTVWREIGRHQQSSRTAEMQAGAARAAATSAGALVASAAGISKPVAVFECP